MMHGRAVTPLTPSHPYGSTDFPSQASALPNILLLPNGGSVQALKTLKRAGGAGRKG